MKTKNKFTKSISFLAITSLFSLNSFAQPAQGTPNENAGDNPYTNNGNGNNGNGNNGNGNNGNGNNGNGNNGNGNNGNGNNGNGNTTPATNKTSSTSTLNVSVGEFYSLKLSDTNATILLDSEEKFANGSESTPVTMTIFSSKKYEINAQVSSAEFSGVKEGTSVNTNNIDLKISKVSQNSNINITERQNKSLKYQNAEKIASSLVATKADVYSLVYAIPQENTAAFLDQFGTTISTEITYTLLPL